SAVYRVEGAKGRPIQVYFCYRVRFSDRDMDRGGDTDACLQHAAYHAFDSVHRRDVGNPDRVGDAAGLHELDIDDVRRAHADQFDHLGRAEDALVGHDRGVHAFGDVLHAVQVLRLDRLLDQFQADPRILQRLQRV